MRMRIKLPVLVRSTNHAINSLIVKKSRNRLRKYRPKEDLRMTKQGDIEGQRRTFYIDGSVR